MLLVTRDGSESIDAVAEISWTQSLASLDVPATIPLFIREALATFRNAPAS